MVRSWIIYKYSCGLLNHAYTYSIANPISHMQHKSNAWNKISGSMKMQIHLQFIIGRERGHVWYIHFIYEIKCNAGKTRSGSMHICLPFSANKERGHVLYIHFIYKITYNVGKTRLGSMQIPLPFNAGRERFFVLYIHCKNNKIMNYADSFTIQCK